VAVAWALASPFTIRHARLVQQIGAFMVGPVKGLAEWWDPKSQLTEKDISPYFWPNGTMPHSAEFNALVAGGFAGGSYWVPGCWGRDREVGLRASSPNTVHFAIRMAALKSMRVVGCGVRGRNG